MGCGSDMLVMGKTPGCGALGGVMSTGCGSGGLGCNDPKIGPRHSRGKVIEEVKDIVLAMLGAPVLDLEISDQMLNISVDWTLKMMEYYAPREFFKYYTFRTTTQTGAY